MFVVRFIYTELPQPVYLLDRDSELQYTLYTFEYKTALGLNKKITKQSWTYLTGGQYAIKLLVFATSYSCVNFRSLCSVYHN